MPAMVVQCALTCLYGCLGMWLASDNPNPKAALLAGLIFGFGGIWLTMKIYVWARYGRAAARSLTMDPG